MVTAENCSVRQAVGYYDIRPTRPSCTHALLLISSSLPRLPAGELPCWSRYDKTIHVNIDASADSDQSPVGLTRRPQGHNLPHRDIWILEFPGYAVRDSINNCRT